jgi:hypothetical protein
MNRTLLHMLRTLPEVYKSNWKDHVNKLIQAYNCTKHESTGFSPFLLLFGRPPRLPIDLMFNTLASKSAARAASKGRKQSDKRVRSTVLLPGDRVLVRNLSPRGGPGEIPAFWE